MGEKIYSSEELNEACMLYYRINHYNYYASSFVSAKNNGLEQSFNSAQTRVKALIDKVDKAGFRNEPRFSEIISKAVESYELKE